LRPGLGETQPYRAAHAVAEEHRWASPALAGSLRHQRTDGGDSVFVTVHHGTRARALAVTGQVERPHGVTGPARRERELAVAPGVLGEAVDDDEGASVGGVAGRPAVARQGTEPSEPMAGVARGHAQVESLRGSLGRGRSGGAR